MKHRNTLIIAYAWCVLLCLSLSSVFFAACGNDDNASDADTDTDTDMDTDTDTDTDSDTDTDTGENETPPDLPESCEAVVVQAPASEQDDLSSESDGDGRFPDIAYNGSVIMAWSYYASAVGSSWQTNVATYDVEPGGIPGPDGGPPEVGFPPAEQGPVAQLPTIAPRGEEFGLVWLDGRWDQSPDCTIENFSECKSEIAFMRLDSMGQPIDSVVPLALTDGAVVHERPGITATDNGYVALWIDQETADAALMAIPIDPKGNAGSVQQISGDQGINHASPTTIAALGEVVIALYVDKNQDRILSQILNFDGEPQGEPTVLDEAAQVVEPRLVAGSDGFVASWCMRNDYDFEVYTQKLNASGTPQGEKNRVTYTPSDNLSSALAWNGSTYAIAWPSVYPNGEEECAEQFCDPQIFATSLDADGKMDSVPVLLSGDPNVCINVGLSWDGSGWTSVWELPRGDRHQIFYGRMVCE